MPGCHLGEDPGKALGCEPAGAPHRYARVASFFTWTAAARWMRRASSRRKRIGSVGLRIERIPIQRREYHGAPDDESRYVFSLRYRKEDSNESGTSPRRYTGPGLPAAPDYWIELRRSCTSICGDDEFPGRHRDPGGPPAQRGARRVMCPPLVLDGEDLELRESFRLDGRALDAARELPRGRRDASRSRRPAGPFSPSRPRWSAFAHRTTRRSRASTAPSGNFCTQCEARASGASPTSSTART